MNPNKYIISKLESFIEDFPQTRVRYEYDEGSETHFIEVLPNEIYHMDSNYIEWEGQMFDDFLEQFPSEGICFISDDAIVGLEDIDFELRGKHFDVLYTTSIDAVSVCEEFLVITSSINSNSSMEECLFDMNKSVLVVDGFGCTFIKPNDTSLLAA